MSRLDRANLRVPVRATEAAEVTKTAEAQARPLYEYFKDKLSRTGGFSVAPILKPDNPDGSSVRDPYVAFRRRTERMQTRKHRQKDEQLCVLTPLFPTSFFSKEIKRIVFVSNKKKHSKHTKANQLPPSFLSFFFFFFFFFFLLCVFAPFR